jgi:hypothetical protein
MELGEFVDTMPEDAVNRDPILKFIRLGLLRLESHPDLPGVYSLYTDKTSEEWSEILIKDKMKGLKHGTEINNPPHESLHRDL